MTEQTTSFPDPLIDDENKSIAHKWKVIIGAVILVGALGYFGFLAFKGAIVYYRTVGEVTERP